MIENLPLRHETWVWSLVRKITWRREWQPTAVFLPGESMDRGAWQATVHGVTKSQTWLRDFQFQFSGGANDKERACKCGRYKRYGFDPWVGKIPWRRKWQPTPVFLPGESHGSQSLAGYSHRQTWLTQLSEHPWLWSSKKRNNLQSLENGTCKDGIIHVQSICQSKFPGLIRSQRRLLERNTKTTTGLVQADDCVVGIWGTIEGFSEDSSIIISSHWSAVSFV